MEMSFFTSKKENINIHMVLTNLKDQFPDIKINHYHIEDFSEKAKKYGITETPSIVIEEKGCLSYSLPVTLGYHEKTELTLLATIPDFDFGEMEERLRYVPYEFMLIEKIRFLLQLQKLEIDFNALKEKAKISRIHITIIMLIIIICLHLQDIPQTMQEELVIS